MAFKGIGFFSGRDPMLVITTAAQSVQMYACSGAVTIRTANAAGAFANVASALTVNLSTSGGLTFFSDSACSNSISSAVIVSGTSSVNVYFQEDSSLGDQSISVAASGYKSQAQTESIVTNPFLWTGAAANSSWSTAANWAGGAVPGTSDLAIIKNNCSNCSPTMTANTTVGGVRVLPGYSGTITQSPSVTLTVNGRGWHQQSGTFQGGDNSITFNGHLVVESGATYTSTSGLLTFRGALWKFNSGANFGANNGSIQFANNISRTITAGGSNYNNVTIIGAYNVTMTLTDTMKVLGNLTGDAAVMCCEYLNGGTIEVTGNLILSGNGLSGGSTNIKIVGPSSNILSTGTDSTLPSLEIASSGTVTYSGTFTVSGNYLVNAGTVDAGTSTLKLRSTSVDHLWKFGSESYNEVETHIERRVTITGDLIINGSLKSSGFCCSNLLYGGSIQIKKDLIALSTGAIGSGGTTTVSLIGPDNGVLNFPGASNGIPGVLTINKTSGATVSLGSTNTGLSSQTLNVLSGNINLAGYNLNLGALTLNGNTLDKNGGVLKVGATVVGTGALYGGTVGP